MLHKGFMNKKIVAMVPVCITFGPVFMVIAGGGITPGHSFVDHVIMFGGAMMLALGLAAMFRVITQQQNVIEAMRAERRDGD